MATEQLEHRFTVRLDQDFHITIPISKFSYVGLQWIVDLRLEFHPPVRCLTILPVDGFTAVDFRLGILQGGKVVVESRPLDSEHPGTYCFLMDSDILAPLCTNGVANMVLTTVAQSKAHTSATRPLLSSTAKTVDYGDFTIGSLDKAVFKDLKITCRDEYVLDCNKFVVTRQSKVMLKALSDPASKESQTNTFNMGLDCATPENTRLLIDCMYEGWKEDEMDEHVNEILQLAHCYESDRIVDMCIGRLSRLLTMATFWKTCHVAVLLMDSLPELLKMCAQFAIAAPNRWLELTRSDDRGDDNTRLTVMDAVGELDKDDWVVD